MNEYDTNPVNNMKNGILWTLKLLLTILILTYIFSIIPFSAIATAFHRLDLATVLYLIPITLISFFVAAAQLKVFTDNHQMHVSFMNIVAINFSTEFYNLFLPGYLAGGAIRWHKLSKDNQKRAEAFAALILNRVVNTLTLALFGLICWAIDRPSIGNEYYGLFFLVLSVGLLSLYAFLFSPYVPVIFQSISHHAFFQSFPAPIVRGLTRLIQAAMEYQRLSLREHCVIVFFSSLWHVLLGLFFFLLARSISIDLSFESLGWIRAMLGFLLLLPISISGFGVREGALIFLFGYFGIVPATALAFSFLVFARTLFLGLIGALVELNSTWFPVKSTVRT
ncbi:lysylphosphatidylglycerol synthase transmembrane domain-containing protein [Nitrospira sp. M1]